jgi:glutaredoxin
MQQVLPLVVVVALVGVLSLWYRRRNGAATSTTATFSADELRALGVPLRTSAVVLFTAPGCAPCVPAKRLLDEHGARHGIPVVAADVSEHAEIATRQHVYRAPTTFVVDEHGHALTRISGVPRAHDLDQILLAAEALAA